MRKLIVIVIGLTGWILTSAQTANTEKGKITGKLAGTDGKAIAAATVSLQKTKDAALVKAVVSNKDGLYELDNIATKADTNTKEYSWKNTLLDSLH